MNSTYAQKSSTVQKAADSKAASVHDSSAQSESLQRKADMANETMQLLKENTPKNRREKMALLEDDAKKLENLNKQLADDDKIKIDFLSSSHLKELRSLSEEKFNKKFNFYYYAGGRNVFLNSFRYSKIKKTDTVRKNCDVDDEKFFYNYLNKPKKRITVYRGDSRSAGHLKAGDKKNALISFLGVVEHQRSSSNKNGMVSTTKNPEVAKGFLNENGCGTLYEIQLDDYIDVNEILAKRNFENRFPTQQEVLSIGDISETSVVKKEIFGADNRSKIQRKTDFTNNAAQRAENLRPNNTGMPDNLKAGIESLSGFSMDNVRVHYNSSKPATVQALAYTQGTDIHVAPGQEKCLPHEAWHVAQQMAGRVSPTTSINGMPVNDNAALEHEADVMGEKAVIQSACSTSKRNVKINEDNVQRMAVYKEYLCESDPVECNSVSNLLNVANENVGQKVYFKYGQPSFVSYVQVNGDLKKFKIIKSESKASKSKGSKPKPAKPRMLNENDYVRINLENLLSKYENVKSAIELYVYQESNETKDPLPSKNERRDHLFNDVPKFLKEVAASVIGGNDQDYAADVEKLVEYRDCCSDQYVHGGVDRNEFFFVCAQEKIRALLKQVKSITDIRAWNKFVKEIRTEFAKVVDYSIDPDCIKAYKGYKKTNPKEWKDLCLKTFDAIMEKKFENYKEMWKVKMKDYWDRYEATLKKQPQQQLQ
jgi:hypothetical protein